MARKLYSPREYWEGDRNPKWERELLQFAQEEFKDVFEVTEEEVAKVTDLLRAYVRHLNPDPDREVKAHHFRLRGDIIVISVTEDEEGEIF